MGSDDAAVEPEPGLRPRPSRPAPITVAGVDAPAPAGDAPVAPSRGRFPPPGDRWLPAAAAALCGDGSVCDVMNPRRTDKRKRMVVWPQSSTAPHNCTGVTSCWAPGSRLLLGPAASARPPSRRRPRRAPHPPVRWPAAAGTSGPQTQGCRRRCRRHRHPCPRRRRPPGGRHGRSG